jgi:hypothetical protein
LFIPKVAAVLGTDEDGRCIPLGKFRIWMSTTSGVISGGGTEEDGACVALKSNALNSVIPGVAAAPLAGRGAATRDWSPSWSVPMKRGM